MTTEPRACHGAETKPCRMGDMANGEYKKADSVVKTPIEPCPVCGADAELWQYSEDFKNGPISKVMMCSNGERFGPQDGVVNDGCLLYMPPQIFYRSRLADAVKFWNEYAKALSAQRRHRHWQRAEVLREVMTADKDKRHMAIGAAIERVAKPEKKGGAS